MAAKSSLTSRKRTRDRSFNSISLGRFTSVSVTKLDDRLVDHVCDSAFLAERGLFTRPKSIKHTSTPTNAAAGSRRRLGRGLAYFPSPICPIGL